MLEEYMKGKWRISKCSYFIQGHVVQAESLHVASKGLEGHVRNDLYGVV